MPRKTCWIRCCGGAAKVRQVNERSAEQQPTRWLVRTTRGEVRIVRQEWRPAGPWVVLMGSEESEQAALRRVGWM